MRTGLAVLVLCIASTAEAQTKVACAGEHSTRSAFAQLSQEYTAKLQDMLGPNFVVGNFGYRRATVQTTGPLLYPASTPYLKTVEFQNSVAFAPDWVILGPFGMHDCDEQFADAGNIDPHNYHDGLNEIVAAYQKLPNPPRILLALPIPYAWGDGVGVMHEVVLPITEQVAKEHGLETIDHWTPYLNRPDLFENPDHFNDAGVELMAVVVYDAFMHQLDAGFNEVPDAGPPPPPDAGADAGADAGNDAGADAGEPDAGGTDAGMPMEGARPKTGGCSTNPGAAFALLAVAVLLRFRRRASLWAWLTLSACSSGVAPVPPVPLDGPDVPRQVRRLSNAELNAVTSDLLGQPANITDGLLREAPVDGWDDDAQSLLVTDPKLDDFVSVAELVASKVSTPAGCADATCALTFASSFGLRAYGRPLTADELTRLQTVYAAGDDHAAGVSLMIEAMLLSPYFIYRTEISRPLSQYEIASELSFFLTRSRPDPELLAAAQQGRLYDADERAKQAQRMLETDNGRLRVRDLLESWLDLHDMGQVNKSLALYPFFVRPVRDAMGEELELFLDDAAFGADGTVSGLFSATHGFPGPILADYYGADLKGPIGNFTPVELDPSRRRGILSLPGFLAHHSALDNTAPVERGLFVRTRLLCDQIGPPPAAALANPPDISDATHTNREKYAQHSADPACSGCHQLMDPIGFGFENFDALGRFQATDNGFPVDSSGQLTGSDVDGPFNGPAELGLKLSQSAQLRQCFAMNLWRAAAGRPVDLTSSQPWPAQTKMTDVLLGVVRSDGFVRRVAGDGESP